MKRTELKRKTKLQAKKPMKSGSVLKTRKPLRATKPMLVRSTLKPGKPKLKHRKPRANVIESKRIDQLKYAGCVCCWKLRMDPDKTGRPLYTLREVLAMFRLGVWLAEAHHLLDGARRLGHMFTIALCPWHHRAEVEVGDTISRRTKENGPALANGTVPFREAWGTDAELLEFQDRLLTAVFGDAAVITTGGR